eukprot:747574-Hanusia_phi.AAC.21
MFTNLFQKLDIHDTVFFENDLRLPHKSKTITNYVRAFGRLSRHRDPKIRRAALLGTAVCLSYIMPRLNDEDDLIKIAALKALERTGDPKTNQLFMELKIVVLKSSNLPKKDKFGTCDAYCRVLLRSGDQEDELGRTSIVWRSLNPRWNMSLYHEVKNPAQDVLVFSLWDEDGEVDDFVGECVLPLSTIPLDAQDFHPGTHSFRLKLKSDDELVHGYNDVSQKNDGKVSRLSVEVGYSEFFNSSNVKTKILEMLIHGNKEVKLAALSTCYSYWADGEENLLAILADLIEDDDEDVRFASMKLFMELSKFDDEMAIELIGKKLTSNNQRCRHTALHILSQIVTKGSAAAVNVVLSLLKEESLQKRDLAYDATSLIADHSAVNILLARAKNRRDESRADCLSLLGLILTKDDHFLLSGTSKQEFDPVFSI